jgi:lauroyl/myristoyl acyltransferase
MPTFDERVQSATEKANSKQTLLLLREILEEVMASSSEYFVIDVMRKHSTTDIGVWVVRSEAGLTLAVRDCSSDGARLQCELLLSLIETLTDTQLHMSFFERAEVKVSSTLRSCMKSGLRDNHKRTILSMLSWAKLYFQQQGRYGEFMNTQRTVMACLLHEPESRVRSIWREYTFWCHLNYARRLIHLENRHESSRYLERFYWPDKADYQQAIQNNAGSRVLVTIHMGDFFGGFRTLSSVSDAGRAAISLRREPGSDHGMQHFSADRVAHQVIYHHQNTSTTIVSALRRGRHTLATLFDLKEDFGSTVTVNFFGRRSKFVKGPALLAILGRSPIYPFVCYEHHGRNCIEMAPVIETSVWPDEDLQQATERITQALVALAENWISRWPAQWKYLSNLPAYFEAAC